MLEARGRDFEIPRWLVCLGITAAFGVATLGACTGKNPDYPEPITCNLGERQCSAATGMAPASGRPVAQVCGLDAMEDFVLIDEPCPVGSQCDAGRCTASFGAKSCARQSDCAASESCVPLVRNGSLGGFCVPSQPSAGLAPGAPCIKDENCQSYHCLQQAQGRYCLLACASDNHCPLATPRCQALNVTITGVQGMVGSCSPR